MNEGCELRDFLAVVWELLACGIEFLTRWLNLGLYMGALMLATGPPGKSPVVFEKMQ